MSHYTLENLLGLTPTTNSNFNLNSLNSYPPGSTKTSFYGLQSYPPPPELAPKAVPKTLGCIQVDEASQKLERLAARVQAAGPRRFSERYFPDSLKSYEDFERKIGDFSGGVRGAFSNIPFVGPVVGGVFGGIYDTFFRGGSLEMMAMDGANRGIVYASTSFL